MERDTAKYAHLLRAVYERPWAMDELLLGALANAADDASAGSITREEFDARLVMLGMRSPGRVNGPRSAAVQIIPVHGVISQGQGLMGLLLGGTSVDQIGADFSAAMQDRQVDAVVLDISSPGGMVDGVPELTALMRSFRGRKPVTAVATGDALSAAYWIASAADEIVVSDSGRVGSIGVYTLHQDVSEMAAREGVKTTVISYGKNKARGNRWEPLSDDARAQMQLRVDYLGQMFDRAVARYRGVSVETVRNDFGQGLSFNPDEAVRLGLADREGTLAGAVSRIGRQLLGSPQQAIAISESTAHATARSEPPADDDAALHESLEDPQTGPQAATRSPSWKRVKTQLALAQIS